MKIYRLALAIEDTLEAEDLRSAWDEFKARLDAGYYGPTLKDIEEGEEIKEEEE